MLAVTNVKIDYKYIDIIIVNTFIFFVYYLSLYLQWLTVQPELSFHKIPSMRNEILRQRWLHNIRRERELPKDSSFQICSN